MEFFNDRSYAKILALNTGQTTAEDRKVLEAVYRLVEKRGFEIVSDNKQLHGALSIEIKEGQFLAVKRFKLGKNQQTFYPCMVQTYIFNNPKEINLVGN